MKLYKSKVFNCKHPLTNYCYVFYIRNIRANLLPVLYGRNYEVSLELIQLDQGMVHLNLILRFISNICKVYLQKMEQVKDIKYTKKWIKTTYDTLLLT
jgi:hypothetical protein